MSLIHSMHEQAKYSSIWQRKQMMQEMCFHSGEPVLVLSSLVSVVQEDKMFYHL